MDRQNFVSATNLKQLVVLRQVGTSNDWFWPFSKIRERPLI